MAKVCAPDGDWRGYRTRLLSEQALGFAPQFHATSSWHWIGGQQNQARFRELDQPHARVRVDDDIAFEPQRRILLTPYPDYRQLSNRKVVLIRELLAHYGFYPAA